MRRQFFWVLLALCLLLPGLSAKARAADGDMFTVDGTFYFRDTDGVRKLLPRGQAILEVKDGSGEEVRFDGHIRSGILSFPLGSKEMIYGNYRLYVSCYGEGLMEQLSCGSNTVWFDILEDTPVGEVDLTLVAFPFIAAIDAMTNRQIGEFTWTLLRDQETVDSGTVGAVEDPNSGHTDWNATANLRLEWGRYQLRLEKSGYQTAVYDFTPQLLENGCAVIEGGMETHSLKMAPEGVLVQPKPTDLRYSGGRVSWRTSFVVPEGDTGSRLRFSKIELTNCATGESTWATMSGDDGGSYDIFYQKPDWPGGTYQAKVTALAQPYYETADSEPAYLIFEYERPKGYLPNVENANWDAENFPKMTWEYDPELLDCVEAFCIIPRVADAEDGIQRDFAHEYLGDRWEGAFRVEPSSDGVYEVPELMEAVRAYGEGWYYFQVGVTSGVDDWRDSGWIECMALFHYVPDPEEPVKNGTLFSTTTDSDVYQVKWTLDNKSRILTMKSAIPDVEKEPIYVASYDENGRFLGIQLARQNQDMNLSQADSAKMFWLKDGPFTPQARASAILTGAAGD